MLCRILLLLLATIIVDASQSACMYGEFRLTNETICRKCQKCGPGYGLNIICSHRITTPIIPKCVPCIHGSSFSTSFGILRCDVCSPLPPSHRETRQCTTTQDRIVSCMEGFYSDEYHDCSRRCCPCVSIWQHRITECDRLGKNCASQRDDNSCIDNTTLLKSTMELRKTLNSTPKIKLYRGEDMSEPQWMNLSSKNTVENHIQKLHGRLIFQDSESLNFRMI